MDVAVPSTYLQIAIKVSYHQIAITLKIVNNEKFETVPQLTRGQNPREVYIDYQESLSTQTELHVLYLIVLKFEIFQ